MAETIARYVRGARRAAGRLVRRVAALRPRRQWQYDDSASPESRARIRALALVNRRSHEPIVDPASTVTVTMTSHGARVGRAWTSIESIADGTMRPRRFVLSLSPRDARRLAPELRRLVRRGLEVLVVEQELGVHTKWYPVSEGLRTPLVTSDDDQLYPRDWLEDLVRVHAQHPDDVVVHRAHVIGLTDGELAPYLRWHPCMTTEASPRHFGTSVSGQLFPETVHQAARAAGTAFLDVAPSNDDIWLHHVALAVGATIRQVRDAPANYEFVPGTQAQGLYQGNVLGGRNDVQAAATYTDADRDRLRADR